MALLAEIEEVAGKVAGYTEDELKKLAAFLFHKHQSPVGLTNNGTPVPLAMQTRDEYLSELASTNEAQFDFVSAAIVRDEIGVAQQSAIPTDAPAIGKTANGYYLTYISDYVWIPKPE